MPAPATLLRAQDVGKTLGHVSVPPLPRSRLFVLTHDCLYSNLMADTFIANAKVDEQVLLLTARREGAD